MGPALGGIAVGVGREPPGCAWPAVWGVLKTCPVAVITICAIAVSGAFELMNAGIEQAAEMNTKISAKAGILFVIFCSLTPMQKGYFV